MADYTTQLRTICETYAGETVSQGYDKIDEIVEKSAPKIFENFQLFDDEYRLPLEKKILRHFYTREICMETVGLWKLHFNNKMHEIMPYYNQLYKSALLDFNPFYDVDLERSHNRTNDTEYESDIKNNTTVDNEMNRYNDGSQETTSKLSNDRNLYEKVDREQKIDEFGERNNDSTRTPNLTTTYTPDDFETHEVNKFLDTPQSNVDNLTDGYLTDVRDIKRTESGKTDTTQTGTETNSSTDTASNTSNTNDKNERNLTDNVFEENSRFNKHKDNTSEIGYSDTKATTNTNTKTNNMEDFFEKVRGKQGTKSYSKMLQEFRDTFLNIDLMIIKDLEPLFMQIW